MEYIITKKDTNEVIADIDTNSPDVILVDGYDIAVIGKEDVHEIH